MKESYDQLIHELDTSAKAGFVSNIAYKNDKSLQKISVRFADNVSPKKLDAVYKHLKQKYGKEGTDTLVLISIDPNKHNTILMYVYDPSYKKVGV